MKSILDRSFRYTSSVQTDLRKTFARVRRAQRQQAGAHVERQAATGTFTKIVPMRTPKASCCG